MNIEWAEEMEREDELLGRRLFLAEPVEIFDEDFAAIDVEEAFRLEATEVAGDQFADGA